MEVEEVSNVDKVGGNTDIDSGIENMEVDEQELTKKEMSRQRTFSATEMSEEQLHASIFRVLMCNFKEPSENFVYLPETAKSFKENPFTSLTDLISQSLMEVLCMISIGNNPFQHLLPPENDNHSLNSFSISPTQNLSPSPSPVLNCPVPLLPFKNAENDSNQIIAMNYLMESYNRVSSEERIHPKKSSVPPLSDVLSDLRSQLVQYTALILQGFLFQTESSGKREVSLLLNPLLQQTLPRGFLNELVLKTYSNPHVFERIFTPLLQALYMMMQNASIVGDEHRQPIQALNDLLEIRVGYRPLCTLITHQPQFLPDVCTQAAGKEFARTSFMGPFLSVSVFAKDEPKVAEKFFSGNSSSDKSLHQTLQQELENTRGSLHKIFHNILVNSSSRDAMLAYLSTILKHNEKRAQFQMDERTLAGDGFMLNLLSVLQMLSFKVKLDKVDFLYPFHPSSLIDIKNDTRLKFTSQETADWLEELGKFF